MRSLRETIDATFSDAELRTLCADLEIDYEDIPGDGKDDKVRELVAYLERRGRIPELTAYVEQKRPHLTGRRDVPPAPRPNQAAPRSRRGWVIGVGALGAVALIALLVARLLPSLTSPALDLTADAVTLREIEPLLREANIVLSAGGAAEEDRVRGYFTGPDSAYHLLAVNSLQVLDGRRFRRPIYLDELDRWYTERVGEENYVDSGRRLHQDQVRAAMLDAWNNHYTQTQTSLEAIVEPGR